MIYFKKIKMYITWPYTSIGRKMQKYQDYSVQLSKFCKTSIASSTSCWSSGVETKSDPLQNASSLVLLLSTFSQSLIWIGFFESNSDFSSLEDIGDFWELGLFVRPSIVQSSGMLLKLWEVPLHEINQIIKRLFDPGFKNNSYFIGWRIKRYLECVSMMLSVSTLFDSSRTSGSSCFSVNNELQFEFDILSLVCNKKWFFVWSENLKILILEYIVFQHRNNLILLPFSYFLTFLLTSKIYEAYRVWMFCSGCYQFLQKHHFFQVQKQLFYPSKTRWNRLGCCLFSYLIRKWYWLLIFHFSNNI